MPNLRWTCESVNGQGLGVRQGSDEVTVGMCSGVTEGLAFPFCSLPNEDTMTS